MLSMINYVKELEAEQKASNTITKYKSDVKEFKEENKGIASNTFSGCTKQEEIDVIYHTGNILKNNNDDFVGKGITSNYDRTNKIDVNDYPNVITYVYMGSENIKHPDDAPYPHSYSYEGEVKNCFVSKEIEYPQYLFYAVEHGISDYDKRTQINYVLIDENGNWESNLGLRGMLAGQTSLTLQPNFSIPENVKEISYLFQNCTFDRLNNKFKIPDKVTKMIGTFYSVTNLSAKITLPAGLEDMTDCFIDTGMDSKVNLEATGKPVIMQYYNKCKVAEEYASTSHHYVYCRNIGNATSQSLSVAQEEKSVAIDRKVSDKTIVIEDETDYITVTVHKKSVDQVVDETQEASQSVESVESENKEEESAD